MDFSLEFDPWIRDNINQLVKCIVHRVIHKDTGEPKMKKRDTNIFKQANRRSPVYNTMLLKSVCKWDTQLRSDTKARPHPSSPVAILHLVHFQKRMMKTQNSHHPRK